MLHGKVLHRSRMKPLGDPAGSPGFKMQTRCGIIVVHHFLVIDEQGHFDAVPLHFPMGILSHRQCVFHLHRGLQSVVLIKHTHGLRPVRIAEKSLCPVSCPKPQGNIAEIHTDAVDAYISLDRVHSVQAAGIRQAI